MLWFNKTRSSDSRASLFWGPLVLAAVVAAALPPAVLGACPQTNLSAIYISSWSSYGFQNFVRLDEGRAPDTVSGKGPYLDPHDYYSNPAKLMVSYNVLGLQIPQLSAPVVSAELQLQVRYLVSFRGSEVYQCGALTDPRVKVAVHRTLGAPLYDDPDANAVYGQGAVSITDGFVVNIPLGSDFIGKLAAAAGTKFLIQGALNSLDNDPYNAEYLYLNAATLILTFANDNGPEIVTQPLGHAIKAGAAVDFHVAACGTLPLSYQWKFNDTILPNATNSSLFLQNASPAQSGNYSVVVSNALGSVPSTTAFLQVSQLAPYFAIQPGSSTIDAGRTNFFLRGLAAGAPPPDYQWRFNDVALGGATNNVLPFGVVTPVNAGSYTLFASNSSGSVTSSPALLKVVPFYIIGPSDLTALLGNQDTLRVQFS